MDGNNISVDVTPAAEIGANRPNNLYISGAPIRAVISLNMLASKAMVPNSVASWVPILGALSWVINTDESE